MFQLKKFRKIRFLSSSIKYLIKIIKYLFFQKVGFKNILVLLILTIFLFKLRGLIFLFELLIKNLYWKFQLQLGNIDKTYQIKYYENANNEWELLDNNIFISRNLSFYYIDDGAINTIVFSRNNLGSNFICLIRATDGKQWQTFLLEDVKLVKFESSWKYKVGSYKLRISFKSFTNLKINRNLKFEMYFIYETTYMYFFTLKRERTKSAIILQVKNNKNNSNIKNNKIALCGPMLHLDLESYEMTKDWIEFNSKLGFHKIILYVIFLESSESERYKKLFFQYKDIVEVRQINYIPNVNYLESKDSNSYYQNANLYSKRAKFIRLNDVTEDWDTHFIYHRGLINGCFLSCFKEYYRVAIFDNDELIYPSFGHVNYLFHEMDQLSPLISTQNLKEQIKNIDCQNDISNYIDNLNLLYLNQSHASDVSLWLHYGHSLNTSLVKHIFHHFKLRTSNMIEFKSSFNISIHDKRNISFSVINQTDFIYLKNLIYFYDNSYMNGESLVELENKYHRRIWMIQEPEKLELGWGKVNFNYKFFRDLKYIVYLFKSKENFGSTYTLYNKITV